MERTFELIKQSQKGDKEAKEQLIMLHSGLVWNVVRRFMGRGYETEDLYQIGRSRHYLRHNASQWHIIYQMNDPVPYHRTP